MTAVLTVMSGSGLAQAPDPQVDSLSYLNRGPLHEAFAEVYSETPQAGLLIDRAPPEAILETPPQLPDAEGMIWIPGYWGWDEERSDFLWISGIYRKVPPGRSWVPGAWLETGDGWRWQSGYWNAAGAAAGEHFPAPPESLEIGPSSPGEADEFYVPGCWLYQEADFQWRPGFWTPIYERWCWVPHRYIWTPQGCLFRRGYWDFPPHRRCVLYAPVHFRQPLYLQDGYRYSPRYQLDVAAPLLTHLFVGRRYCHYYFGDYFGDQHRRRAIYPWISTGSRQLRYDPLHTYFVTHGGDHNRALLKGVGAWHEFFRENPRHRPPVTLQSTDRRADRSEIGRMAAFLRQPRGSLGAMPSELEPRRRAFAESEALRRRLESPLLRERDSDLRRVLRPEEPLRQQESELGLRNTDPLGAGRERRLDNQLEGRDRFVQPGRPDPPVESQTRNNLRARIMDRVRQETRVLPNPTDFSSGRTGARPGRSSVTNRLDQFRTPGAQSSQLRGQRPGLNGMRGLRPNSFGGRPGTSGASGGRSNAGPRSGVGGRTSSGSTGRPGGGALRGNRPGRSPR